jgi:hypothetical protein
MVDLGCANAVVWENIGADAANADALRISLRDGISIACNA